MLGLKAKLYAVGAAALSVLFLFLRIEALKHKNKKLKNTAETLKARQHVQATQKKIKRKEEKKLHSRRVEILEELEKEREEFEGLDNLSNANED